MDNGGSSLMAYTQGGVPGLNKNFKNNIPALMSNASVFFKKLYYILLHFSDNLSLPLTLLSKPGYKVQFYEWNIQ